MKKILSIVLLVGSFAGMNADNELTLSNNEKTLLFDYQKEKIYMYSIDAAASNYNKEEICGNLLAVNDQKTVAAIGSYSEFQLYDINTQQTIGAPIQEDFVKFSPTGSMYVTANDGKYQIYTTVTQKPFGMPRTATKNIFGMSIEGFLSFSPDETIYVIEKDSLDEYEPNQSPQYRFYNTATQEAISPWIVGYFNTFSTDGTLFSANKFDPADLNPSATACFEVRETAQFDTIVCTGPGYFETFNPIDKNIFITSKNNDCVDFSLYKILGKNKKIHTLGKFEGFSPNGKTFVTSHYNKNTHCRECNLYSTSTLALIGKPKQGNLNSFSPDGKALVIRDNEMETKLYSIETGKLIASINSPFYLLFKNGSKYIGIDAKFADSMDGEEIEGSGRILVSKLQICDINNAEKITLDTFKVSQW